MCLGDVLSCVIIAVYLGSTWLTWQAERRRRHAWQAEMQRWYERERAQWKDAP